LTLASTVVKSGWKVLSRIYSRNMSTGYYGIYYPLRSDVRAHLHDISFWTSELWHLLLLRSLYAFFRTRRFLIILRTQARTIFMNLIL
jgi:predicted cupin superfamily sugar epimerase